MALLGIAAANIKDDRGLDYYAYFHALPLENARYLELVDPLNTRPPWEATFDVAKFHAFTGAMIDEKHDLIPVTRIVRENVHEPGMMAFGRFRHVFPGTFAAYFDLRLDGGDENRPVAGLDVATEEGKIVLARKEVGDRPFSGVVRLPFTVQDFGYVEPRISYYGLGEMVFRGMSIRETPSPGYLVLPPLVFQRVPIETVRSIFLPYLLHVSAMFRDQSQEHEPAQTSCDAEVSK